MPNTHKTFFNWSSGKDSALALYHLQRQDEYIVDRLLTTVNSHYNRVSMHGLPRPVLEAQTAAIGIPLDVVEVPEKPSMETYNALMTQKMQQMVSDGYTHAAFGDIFLEDLKVYREKMLATQGIQAVFPIWKRDTRELYMEFLSKGFRTVIVCINNDLLDESFLGTELSLDLLEQFPKSVDPCGENGEFHTFCFDGPIFNHPIPFEVGEKVFRTYDNPSDKTKPIQFGFCDILLQ
ncbi:adenine nucleotide alpha hydrolase [Flagellimonas algicola]|uniref:Adenine nucleotide alpha hydrolase n=1 Tax=Flagellimonas algicola TaxID=2583815 RepID=A0ABY2WJN9_9FLAO|nr:adenine nucleotide alpha hydrolase [Allomuricauda algicola]TMU54726.1 adenine nucleotide alpha hydrolase [Allomuricauda algicola]